MSEWAVVGIIITLVTFLIAVMTPILKLNTSITKLNVTIDNLTKTVINNNAEFKTHEQASNKKFEEYENRLTSHTVKIKNLEREVFKDKGGNK